MENTVIEQPWLEKSNWGKGEWNNEPDEQVFTYRGYDCILFRGNVGAWCGYVRVPKNSKFMDPALYRGIQVHGGITFAEIDEYDDFWIGFDCCHAGDLMPVQESIKSNYSDQLKQKQVDLVRNFGDPLRLNNVYRNLEYATNELMNVVDQMTRKRRIVTQMERI